MDPRLPHNAYRYKPMDQAAPIYIPPSKSTQRILPVPQEEGQGDYHYGRPGEVRPTYIPSSADSKKDKKMKTGMSKSDERSKKEISRLESTNEALMKALDDSAANTGGNMPETEYPSLPSRTSFADTPAADKVAAQNVGIQAASAPPPQAAPAPQAPPQMQPNPQQQNFAQSQNPAFNVNRGMPDMSALDEAYRRQSQGG
jgi:hypothetical protein